MISALNAIIQAFADVVISLMSLLPASPFTWDWSFLPPGMAGWINYFIPVPALVSVLMSYVLAVAVWYLVRWILRFVRYIG